MAIFGSFSVNRAQLARDARFAVALAYVDDLLRPGSEVNRRVLAAPSGPALRIDLAGGTFVLEQAYETRQRSECYFESHRRNIDIQVIVAGSELMEVEPIGRLAVTVPYDGERDLIKYGDAAAASHLVLQAGDAAVFFPADGHMPMLQVAGQAGLVRKCVVKVPVGPG